jgi:hypothetical protein
MKSLLTAAVFLILISSCQKKDDPVPEKTEPLPVAASVCPTCTFPDTVWKDDATGPKLIFRFKFDSTQARLDNTGTPAAVANGNAAQSPVFIGISAHYLELAATDTTQLGRGAVLYKGEETDCRGSRAIVFCKSVVCKENDIFFSIPLSRVPAATYKWLRVSIAYQNFIVKVRSNSAGTIEGTLASFVGFNTYVSKYKMKNTVMTPTLNPEWNRPQGYWGFYTTVFGNNVMLEGQAVQTTVVNPNPASPIPAGSCVVTGKFFNTAGSQFQPLIITGNETQDLVITVSLSTTKSFEWKELTADGLFQPEIGETVVDMGLRGLLPKY